MQKVNEHDQLSLISCMILEKNRQECSRYITKIPSSSLVENLLALKKIHTHKW